MLSESTESAPKPLPVWLSIPIILLCLSGGGYIIHWYVMTDPISHDTKILADAPTQAQWQTPARTNVIPGGRVNRTPAALARRSVSFDPTTGVMLLRTEKVRATLVVTKGQATLRNIFYVNVSFLPQDAYKKILQVRNLIPDQKRTEAMKLDIHQVGKLRTLQGNPPLALSDTDKASLLDSAKAYAANQSAALEPDMLKGLDDIADRSMDATKQETVDRAAQIDAMITPDMWAQDATASGAAPVAPK